MNFLKRLNEAPINLGEVDDDDDVRRDTMGSLFSKEDQFAAAFATIGGLNFDLFYDFLRFYEYVEKLDLQKQMHHAIKNTDSYWRVVESFVNREPDEILKVLDGTRNLNESNGFKGAAVELYHTGTSEIDLTEEENWQANGHSDKLKGVLENPNMVKIAAVAEKKNSIANAVKALTDGLPMAHAPGNNASARYEKAEELINDFNQGRFEVRISKSVKFPKESGVGLPHTLSPKKWLARALTNLFTAITDCPTGIAIRSSSILDVSRIKDGSHDPVYFSDDEESPYNLDYHPSWTVEGDPSEPWSWREIVEKTVKRVNLEFSDHSTVQRDSAVGAELRSYLISECDQLDLKQFQFKFMFAKGEIPYFKFYSDGLSTVEKVYENVDFLHVVSVNVISQIPDNDFMKIVLPDFNSVVLIPTDFCSFMGLSQFKVSSGFTVTASDDLSSVRNLVLCYQLSHTFAFIDSLEGNSVYEYRKHAEALEKMIVRKGANRALFPSGESRDSKLRSLQALSNFFVGGNFGLVISAERSKIGGRTTREINKNSTFTKLTKRPMEIGHKKLGRSFLKTLRSEEKIDSDDFDLSDEMDPDGVTDEQLEQFFEKEE